MMKHVAATIALLATPVAVMSACSKQASNPSPTTTSSTSGSAAQKLNSQLNTADGKHVADATIDFTSGYATVTVETVATGILTPGFHGLNIHAVGKCEANSAAPNGGQTADFASAGDRLQAPDIPASRPAGICRRCSCALTALASSSPPATASPKISSKARRAPRSCCSKAPTWLAKIPRIPTAASPAG